MLTTRDAQEQDSLLALNTISFSIGLTNGFSRQAFNIIDHETKGGVQVLHAGTNPIDPAGWGTAFVFNGTRYPEYFEVEVTKEEAWVQDNPNERRNKIVVAEVKESLEKQTSLQAFDAQGKRVLVVANIEESKEKQARLQAFDAQGRRILVVPEAEKPPGNEKAPGRRFACRFSTLTGDASWTRTLGNPTILLG